MDHQTYMGPLKAQTFAGREITLVPGRLYIATRAMRSGSRSEDLTDVYIVDLTVQGDPCAPPCLTLRDITVADATQLLAEFNDDPRGTLYGRTW
jgi:hypothetical protein